MKRGIFLFIVLFVIGCGSDSKRPNVTTLSTFKDSTSYALGADLGTNLKQQKVDIDYDVFMAGLLDGRPLYTSAAAHEKDNVNSRCRLYIKKTKKKRNSICRVQ